MRLLKAGIPRIATNEDWKVAVNWGRKCGLAVIKTVIIVAASGIVMSHDARMMKRRMGKEFPETNGICAGACLGFLKGSSTRK